MTRYEQGGRNKANACDARKKDKQKSVTNASDVAAHLQLHGGGAHALARRGRLLPDSREDFVNHTSCSVV